MKKTISVEKLNRRRSFIALCMVAVLSFALIFTCAVLLSEITGGKTYAEYSLIPTIDEYRDDSSHDFKNFNLYVLNKTGTGKTVVDEKGNPVTSFNGGYNYIISMTDFDSYTNNAANFNAGIFADFVGANSIYSDTANNAKLYITLSTANEFRTFTIRSNGGMTTASTASSSTQVESTMNFYSSANYKLGNNIDMSALPVTMISALYAGGGNKVKGFVGELDGQGFEISGLTLYNNVMGDATDGLMIGAASTGMRIALFSALEENEVGNGVVKHGVIKNIGFRNITVDMSAGLGGNSVKVAGLIGENYGSISHTYIYNDDASAIISGGVGSSGIADINENIIDNVYVNMANAPKYQITQSGQFGSVTNAFYVANAVVADNAGENSTVNNLKTKINLADASASSLRDESVFNGAKWYTDGTRNSYIGLSGYRKVTENGIEYQAIYNPADFINISTGAIAKNKPIGIANCIDMSYVSDTAYANTVSLTTTFTSISAGNSACTAKHIGTQADSNHSNHNIINLHLKPSSYGSFALFQLSTGSSSATNVTNINFVGGSMNYAYLINSLTVPAGKDNDKLHFSLLGGNADYSSSYAKVDNVHSSFSYIPLMDDNSFYTFGKSIMVGGLLGQINVNSGNGNVSVLNSSMSGEITGGIINQSVGGYHTNDLIAFGGIIAKSYTPQLSIENVTFSGKIEGASGVKRATSHNSINVGGLVGVIAAGNVSITHSTVSGSLYSTSPNPIALDIASANIDASANNHTDIYDIGGFVGAYFSQNAVSGNLTISDSTFDGQIILNEIRGKTTIDGANEATLLSSIYAASFVGRMNLGKLTTLDNCIVTSVNADTPNISLSTVDDSITTLNATELKVYGLVGLCEGTAAVIMNGGEYNPIIELNGLRSRSVEVGGGAQELMKATSGFSLGGKIDVSTNINNTAITSLGVYGLAYTAQGSTTTSKLSTQITVNTPAKVNGVINVSGGTYTVSKSFTSSQANLENYINNNTLNLTGGLMATNVNIAGLSIGTSTLSFDGANMTNTPTLNIDNVTTGDAKISGTLNISGAFINAKSVSNLTSDALINIGTKTGGVTNVANLDSANIRIAGLVSNLSSVSGDSNSNNINNSEIVLNLGDSGNSISNLYIGGLYASLAKVNDAGFYIYDHNSVNNGNISVLGGRAITNLYTGGIIGYSDCVVSDNNVPSISGLLNKGNIEIKDVNITNAYIGGIVANVFTGFVSDVNNMGNISVSPNGVGTYNIGGIYGTFADNNSSADLTLGANINIGKIDFTNAAKNATANIGGIGGSNTSNIYRMINRYNINYGNITVNGGNVANVGGLIGNVVSKSGNLSQSVSVINHGDIMASDVTTLNAGGIHGNGNALMEYAVNYGGVSGTGNLGMLLGNSGNQTATFDNVMAFYHAGTQKIHGGTATNVTVTGGYTNADKPADGYGVSGIDKKSADYEMYGYDASGKFVGNDFTKALDEVDSNGDYRTHIALSPYANVSTAPNNTTPNPQIDGRETKITVLGENGTTTNDRYFIYAVASTQGKQSGEYLTTNSATSENEREVWAQITESRDVDIINADDYYNGWQLHATDNSKKISITPTVRFNDTYKDVDGVKDLVGGRITFSVNLDSFFGEDLQKDWKIFTNTTHTGDGKNKGILSPDAIFSSPTAVSNGFLTANGGDLLIENASSKNNTLNNVWRIFTVVTVEKTLKSGEVVSKPWRIEILFMPIGNSVRLDNTATDPEGGNELNEEYKLRVNDAITGNVSADNANNLGETQIDDSTGTYRYNRYEYLKPISLNMGTGYTDFTYSGYRDNYHMGNYFGSSITHNQDNMLIQTDGSLRAKFVIKGFADAAAFTAKLVSKNDSTKVYDIKGYNLSSGNDAIAADSLVYYDTSEYLTSDSDRKGQLKAYDITTETLKDESDNPMRDDQGKELQQTTGKMYLHIYLRDTLPSDDYYLQISYTTDAGITKIGAEIGFNKALSTRATLSPNGVNMLSYPVFNYGESTAVSKTQSGVRNRITEFLYNMNNNGTNNFPLFTGQTPDFSKLLVNGNKEINLFSFISGIQSAVNASIRYPHNGNGGMFTIKTERKVSTLVGGGTQFYYYVYTISFRIYAEAGNYKDYTLTFTEPQYKPTSDTSRLFINGTSSGTSTENAIVRVFRDGGSEVEIPRSLTGETYLQIGYNQSSLMMSNGVYWQTSEGKDALVFVMNKDGTEYEFDWFNDSSLSEINMLGVKIQPTIVSATSMVQFKISFTSESEGGTYRFYIKYKEVKEDVRALTLDYTNGIYTLTDGYYDNNVIGDKPIMQKRGVADGSPYYSAIQTQISKAASREHVSFGLEFGQSPASFFFTDSGKVNVVGRWESDSNKLVYMQNGTSGEEVDNYYRNTMVNNFYLNPLFGSDDETVLSTWLNFELYLEGTGDSAGYYNTLYVNLNDMGFPTDNDAELKRILVSMGILLESDVLADELYLMTNGGVSEKWLKIKYYSDYSTDPSKLVDRSKNIVINESISVRFMLQAENKSYYSIYTVQPNAAPEDQNITVVLKFDDKSASELSKLVITAKTYINTSKTGSIDLKATRLSNIFVNIDKANKTATVTFRRMLRAYYEFDLSLPTGYSFTVDLSGVSEVYRHGEDMLNLTGGGLNEVHTITINVRATDKPWGESGNVWA